MQATSFHKKKASTKLKAIVLTPPIQKSPPVSRETSWNLWVDVLSFAAKVVVPGRAFLRRLYNELNRTRGPFHVRPGFLFGVNCGLETPTSASFFQSCVQWGRPHIYSYCLLPFLGSTATLVSHGTRVFFHDMSRYASRGPDRGWMIRREV